MKIIKSVVTAAIFVDKAITLPPHALQQLRLGGILLDLLAQIVNVNDDGPVIAIAGFAPDMIVKLAGFITLSGMLHQKR